MVYFTKRYHPPGTSPGTLAKRELPPSEKAAIELVVYSDTVLEEHSLASASEALSYLDESTISWIHVRGHVTPALLGEFADGFGLHTLALEDVLNIGQRPKSETYDGQLFVITSLPRIREGKITSEQVSLFVGKNYLISFHASETDIFAPVRKRLRIQGGRLRTRKADYLFYCLLDVVVDECFPVLERFGDRIEDLEQQLLAAPTRETLVALHEMKRELLLMRRMQWPQRELVSTLIRDEEGFISQSTQIHLRDCYDHSVQVIDLLELYREMTASMLDVYLSSISYRLNDVMRVLTLIATIFIPLTFVVGVYGMNFSVNADSPWAMPELNWYYGYPLVWLVMLLLSAGMIVFFKRRGWFR